MSDEINLLAFDLGASNGRAIVGSFDGDKLSWEVVHKFENGADTAHGSMYWDWLRLFSEIKTGLRKAADYTNGRLTSIGIDTWGVDYALLDKADNVLGVPYHYRDRRTDGLLEEIFTKIPKETIYKLTGIQFMQINTIVQLYADRKYRPWMLDAAETVLFMPDLLNYLLTGKKCSEYTISSTSQLFNPKTNEWAAEIFEALELPLQAMQSIVYPGSVIGELTKEVQEECGLQSSVPVVAVGSHDTASAVAATPLEDTNSIYISSGTWSLLGMELDEPLITDASLEENFTNETGVAQKIRFLKNISGLWLIQECKRSWERQGMELSYSQISQAAVDAEPFKFCIDPDDDRFLSPDDMPAAINEYCRETGQPTAESYGEMARAIYESLAISYKKTIANIEKLTGTEVKTINMVGGGIQAEILCQFTADITGRRVVTGPIEATAIGSLLAQLMANGNIATLAEGRKIVRNSVTLKEYQPQT